MGRPPKLTDHQRKEAIRRRDKGEETLAEIGRSYNVSGWTIARLGREHTTFVAAGSRQADRSRSAQAMTLLLKRLFRKALTSTDAHQATLHNIQAPPLPPEWRDVYAGAVGTKGVSLLDWWRQAFGNLLDEIAGQRTWGQQRAALLRLMLREQEWSNLYLVVKDKPSPDIWQHLVANAELFTNAPKEAQSGLLLQRWMVAILTFSCLMEFGMKYFGIDNIKKIEIGALGEYEKEIVTLDTSVLEQIRECVFRYEDEQANWLADFKENVVNPIIQEQWTLAHVMREQVANSSLDVPRVTARMTELRAKKEALAASLLAR